MTFLIFGATGQQGGAVVDALLSKGVTAADIVGVTRNPDSESSKAKIVAKGLQAIKGDLTSMESVKDAIVASKADTLWFMTDFHGAKSAAAETQQGKNVVDAIKKCAAKNEKKHLVKYIVFSSVGDADNCPKNVQHFWSKAAVEEYMAKEFEGTDTKWAVIRPVAFLENLDNPGWKNPLTKGKVAGLTKAGTSLKHISIVDIGKGSAVLLQNPDTYAGKKIEAAGCAHTGTQLADILTKVSGTPCKYKLMMPRFLVWLFMRDMYHMIKWFENTDGYSADISEFKKMVPDAMDATAFFKAKGQWSDGEKFFPSSE